MPRLITAFSQFFDDNGDPLINGKLKFVESGTNNTDKDTFADINETIENSNPVILDGAGRCPNIFGSGTYNVISYTSDDVQIQQFDPVSGQILEGAFSSWSASVIYDSGDLVTGSDGNYYRSLTNNNQNQEPSASPSSWEQVEILGFWNTNKTYGIGDIVILNTAFYTSLTASNSGNNPETSEANWRISSSRGESSDEMNNFAFTSAVATKALTFAIKTKNLTDPSADNRCGISFRSATLTAGDYDLVECVAATSVVAPDGATLGFAAGATDFIYLYALNNAGTVEAAISGTVLDESVLHTTVAIDATADSDNVLYSATLRADVAIRLIGRIKIETGAVAGEWDNAPTELFVGKSVASVFPASMVWLHTGNGYGSTNTTVHRLTTTVENVGSDITYADSASLGASFTINTTGLYAISYSKQYSAAGSFGLSLNSAQLTTNIDLISAADRLALSYVGGANLPETVAVPVYLTAGDVIRPHGDTTTDSSTPERDTFIMTRVG